MVDLFQIINGLANEQSLPLADRIWMFMNILFRYPPKRIEDKSKIGYSEKKRTPSGGPKQLRRIDYEQSDCYNYNGRRKDDESGAVP